MKKTQKPKPKTQNQERTRLLVRRSLRGAHIQIVKDDGNVVAGTWALKKDIEAAAKKIAEAAIKQKVKHVRFDRGKHQYHGIVKKIAEAARKAGLEF